MSNLTNIDGMKFCLALINELRQYYKGMNYSENELTIEQVLSDIENEIGIRAYRDWRPSRSRI